MRPEIREALFLASPDLDAALERWHDDTDGKKERDWSGRSFTNDQEVPS
jgi:hypothetical protein